ncbi:MAG: metallophosphoesterase [Methermicoccaceae archaeon]
MIGILSDTHDHLEPARAAVELFNDRSVEYVLHAGDVVSPFMVRAFSHLDSPLYVVYGNNDGDRLALKHTFEDAGFFVLGDFGVVDGIALLHGTNPEVCEALASSGRYRMVVCGHTHHPEIRHVAGCTLINPGECSGVLTGRSTVALVSEEGARVVEI